MGDYYLIKEGPGAYGSTEFTVVVQKVLRCTEAFIRDSKLDPKKVLKKQFLELCERYFDSAWADREIVNPEAEAYRASLEGRSHG